MAKLRKDRVGEIYGKLTVLRRGATSVPNCVMYWVQYSCGSPEKKVLSNNLVNGTTVSCGCIKKAAFKNKVLPKRWDK